MTDIAGPGLLDLVRVFGALLIVVGLAAGCGLAVRRGLRPGASRRLRVEERLALAKGAQLVIVADGPRRLLVGVSDKGISLVTELSASPATAGSDEPVPAASAAPLSLRAAAGSFAEKLRRAVAERAAARGHNP